MSNNPKDVACVVKTYRINTSRKLPTPTIEELTLDWDFGDDDDEDMDFGDRESECARLRVYTNVSR